MNTEEKAKAYDEALGRAKSLFGNCPIGSERAKICSIIFPQLAESEDERVRKSIIHILQVGGYMSPEEKDKAFVYLEKQKEHQSCPDAPKEKKLGSNFYPSDKDKNLDEIAQDYVDGVKQYNQEPTWDLMQTAVCYGYHLSEEQFEKNRLANCDAVSKEECDRETGFAMEIIEKEHRQPTFNDAINYGMRLQKQKEQKPLTTEETELNSIAFLEQMGYTCIPPRKEQKLAESHKRNKPKESWLSRAKYEIEHADELLIQKQEELREIRELKKKEQKPKDTTLSREDCLHQLFENGTITMADYLYLTTNRRKQKPAEKQDYSSLNDLERAILRGFLAAGVENVPVTIIKETAKECLAQMKPAEWGEEDEKMLIWLCRIIHSRVVNKELSLAEESELGKWMDKRLNHEPQHEKKWSEFDEDCLRRAIWYVENPAPSVVKNTNLVLWLQSLPERFNLEPKEEWSDEDTEMYINVASSLRGYACGLENEEHKRHIQKELDWLENRFKSLRPQPKQEWSEEDKAIVGCIACCLDGQFVTEVARKQCLEWFNKHRRDFLNAHHTEWSEEDEEISKRIISDLRWGRRNSVSDKDIRQYDEEINWMENKLKSILLQGSKDSLQTHWKPSEEQKEALEYVIRDYREDCCNATANYLQEVLDHLKNM